MFYATKQILENVEITKRLGVNPGLKGKSFIVQGFGNVGYWASNFFTQAGALLVGVAEYDGSIYNPEGINPNDLLSFKKSSHKGGVKGYPGSRYFPDEAAIYQPAYSPHYPAIFSYQRPSKKA